MKILDSIHSIQSSLKPHPLCVIPVTLVRNGIKKKKTFFKWRVKMPAILTL